MKKYAPDKPDAVWYRSGDTDYLSELVKAAGLSARGAARALGVNERAFRYCLAGERKFTYAEQFCLEVLADSAQQEGADASTENR